MKLNRPHGQWLVLQAVLALPPFGVTTKQIQEMVTSPMSGSGVRTRALELVQMSMLRSEDRKNHKHLLYHLTPLGWQVAMSSDGPAVLRAMRASHAKLEMERAEELAPLKDKWRRLIYNEMSRLASTLR